MDEQITESRRQRRHLLARAARRCLEESQSGLPGSGPDSLAEFMKVVEEADYGDTSLHDLIDQVEHLPYESTWSVLRFRLFGGKPPPLNKQCVADLLDLIARLER